MPMSTEAEGGECCEKHTAPSHCICGCASTRAQLDLPTIVSLRLECVALVDDLRQRREVLRGRHASQRGTAAAEGSHEAECVHVGLVERLVHCGNHRHAARGHERHGAADV